MRTPIFSPPGWVMAIFAAIVVFGQTKSIIDPVPFMKEFGIQSMPAVRVIGLTLIAINIYDFIGAWQDNWAIYWWSLISRGFAASLFYSFGTEAWRNLAMVEAGTMVILGVAMVVGREGQGAKGGKMA